MSPTKQVKIVQQLVAEASGFTVGDIVAHTRPGRLAWARQVAMWIAAEILTGPQRMVVFGRPFVPLSKNKLGDCFNRDHGTISYAIYQVNNFRSINPKIRRQIDRLSAKARKAIDEINAR